MSLNEAIAAVEELKSFALAAAIGLHQSGEATQWLRVKREVAETLKKPAPFKDDRDFEQALERAQKREVFAIRERDGGFPYLNGIVAIRLWTILEVAVDDLALGVLKDPNPPAPEILRGLKGPLLEFAAASPDQQAEYLLGELKLNVKAVLKSGVGRFEALISPLGVGGAVNEHVRKALLELSEVRNLLVHRSGTADRRFITACPWRNLQPGAPVNVSTEDAAMYEAAALWYLTALAVRIARGREPVDQEYVGRAEKIAAGFARTVKSVLETRADSGRPAPDSRT